MVFAPRLPHEPKRSHFFSAQAGGSNLAVRTVRVSSYSFYFLRLPPKNTRWLGCQDNNDACMHIGYKSFAAHTYGPNPRKPRISHTYAKWGEGGDCHRGAKGSERSQLGLKIMSATELVPPSTLPWGAVVV
jgi:hypothetical protein